MSASVSSGGSRVKITSRGKRLPPPGKKFEKAKPCLSADDVAKLQSTTLVSAVNECKVAEEKRLQALARASTKARTAELEERHDRERARERQRIEMLMTELNAVKSASSEGGLDASERKRSSLIPVKTMDANRFDQTHLRRLNEKWIGRLDHLEKRFEAKSRPRYNEYDERKKLILLEEKRSVIRDMITVQTNAIRSISNPESARPSCHDMPQRPSRPRSECGRSEASYATFASSSKSVVPVPRNHHQFQAKVDRMVPKLEIGSYKMQSKV